MRCLHILDTLNFAGTERYLIDLTLALRGASCEPVLACLRGSPLYERAVDVGLCVLPLRKNNTVAVADIFTIRQKLRSKEIDIVHAHNGRTVLAGALAVMLSGRGHCVVTQHFLTPHHLTRKGVSGLVYRSAHHWVNGRVSRFVAISNHVASAMKSRKEGDDGKISVVLNGIADARQLALRPSSVARHDLGIGDAPLIVCAARLESEKDLPTLLRAMALLQKSCPSARCVIAGEGELRGEIQGQIEALGIDSSVKLLGFQNDVLSLISAANAFVLPSTAEPFGLVLLEAMSLRVPVIAVNTGGPAEIVIHGETGLLVPPNDPQSLATAILQLCSNPKLAKEMGLAGRRRFEQHFTAGRMARDMIEVYRQAMADDPRRSHSRK